MKPPAPEPSLVRVAFWYALLSVVAGHAMGGLVGIATNFVLKDRLGLGPEAMARYGAIVALPTYVAFLFGYARDRWVARVGDRNLAALGAMALALVDGLLASAEPTYGRMLAAALASVLAVSLLNAAVNGAIVRFGAARGVTDRLSAFNLALSTVVFSLVAFMAGWAAERVAFRTLLGITALLNVVALGLLLLAPRGTVLPPTPQGARPPVRSLVADFVSLVRSPAYLAALGLSLAYSFGPASGPAFLYFLTDHLGVSPGLLGTYGAVSNLATLPIALLYGMLARRMDLRGRMALAVVLFFMQPFLFFAFRTQADLLPVGALFGASNAIFLAASFDQLLRAIPEGSEGLGFAVYGTFTALVIQGSNLIGARVYAAHGLAPCVWLTFPVAALGFPCWPSSRASPARPPRRSAAARARRRRGASRARRGAGEG